jgi:chromosome segregation ATPase
MKPLNQKERSKAYQKVVGLFVLCFALAMVLGFTTLNTNKLTDSKTKSDLQRLQDQLKFQQEIFAPNVDQVTKTLAKVPVYREEGENIEVLNSNIASVLSQTIKEVKEDESWESLMYKNVLKVYSDLQLSYKDQLRMKDELDSWKNSTQGSDKDLQRCLDEKRALQSELNMLKLAGGGGGGNIAQIEKELQKAKKDLEDCNKVNGILRNDIEKLRNR